MDLIDRQEVIEALGALCDRECEYSKKQRSVMCGACHLGSAFDVVEQLPSAQSETEERNGKSAQNVPKEDLISRKAAIDEINKLEYPSSLVDVKWIIVDLHVLVTVGVNQSGEGMHQEVRVALWDNIGKRFHVYEDKGTIIGEVRSWAYLPNPYDVGVVWYTRGAI